MVTKLVRNTGEGKVLIKLLKNVFQLKDLINFSKNKEKVLNPKYV